MKKIILSSILMLASTNIFAYEVSSFNEMKTAVIDGHRITLVIDFAKCGLPIQNFAQFTPDALQVVGDHISTSLMHFTLNNPKWKDYPVNEYVSFQVNADNTLVLTSQTLDVKTYEGLGKFSVTCHMGSGVRVYY